MSVRILFLAPEKLLLTGSEDLADSVEVAQFALSASNEVGGADACVRLVLDGDLSRRVS